RSTMTTVTSSASNGSALATVPDTIRSSIAPLAPNVDRTSCSNAGSAVSTVTTVLFAAFEDLLIRIAVSGSPEARLLGRAVAVVAAGARRRRRLGVLRGLRLLLRRHISRRAGRRVDRRNDAAGAVALRRGCGL